MERWESSVREFYWPFYLALIENQQIWKYSMEHQLLNGKHICKSDETDSSDSETDRDDEDSQILEKKNEHLLLFHIHSILISVPLFIRIVIIHSAVFIYPFIRNAYLGRIVWHILLLHKPILLQKLKNGVLKNTLFHSLLILLNRAFLKHL